MKLSRRAGRFLLDGHRADASVADLLKWQFGGNRARWPQRVENGNHPPPPLRSTGNALHATWIGQSTVLIQTAGVNILTDPFLTDRASPLRFLGPRRVRAPGLLPQDMPPIDIVLLSHNHYDHMDLTGLSQLVRHHRPKFITPAGNARYLRPILTGLEIVEREWGGAIELAGITITLTPALHWSKRTLLDTNRALWGAFHVNTPGGGIYFAGDTGYGDGRHFRAIRTTFGPPRLSLLPIGAYEPRWFMKPQHMNPEDAVRAHLDLESQSSLAIHHSTLQLTDEAIDAPAKDLAVALRQLAVDPSAFLVPDIGQTTTIPEV